LKQRRLGRGNQRCKNICALITVVNIGLWAFLGFIGGLRGSGQLPSALQSWGLSASYFFDDAILLIRKFPPALQTAVTNIKTGVNTAVDGIQYSTQANILMKDVIGGGGYPGPAADTVTALGTAISGIKGINDDAPVIDQSVASLATDSNQLNSDITAFTSSFNTLSGAQNYPSGTYQISPALSFSTANLGTLGTDLNTHVTSAQSQSAVTIVTNSGLPANQDNYLINGQQVVDAWTNITATVAKALLNKGDVLKVTLSNELDKFSGPLITQSRGAEKELSTTILGFKGTLKGIMEEQIFAGGVTGFGNSISSGIPVLFVFGLAITTVLILFVIFRYTTWMKW
jgi:hypothetical protein